LSPRCLSAVEVETLFCDDYQRSDPLMESRCEENARKYRPRRVEIELDGDRAVRVRLDRGVH
jgi:hypothetical protein